MSVSGKQAEAESQRAFDFFVSPQSAREYHESQKHCEEVLRLLRKADITKHGWEQGHGGARMAPSIDILRNAYGFEIGGYGTTKKPYFLLDRRQWPTRVFTTTEIKQAYQDSQHWSDTRGRRWEHDGYKCVVCTGHNDLPIQCHHLVYNLFDESLDELITVCEYHHQLIHDNSRIGFPIGVSLAHADRLVGYHEFEEWLKP